ncbi:unnamed protein product, partial [Rotaria sp. Silwood2]
MSFKVLRPSSSLVHPCLDEQHPRP